MVLLISQINQYLRTRVRSVACNLQCSLFGRSTGLAVEVFLFLLDRPSRKAASCGNCGLAGCGLRACGL